MSRGTRSGATTVLGWQSKVMTSARASCWRASGMVWRVICWWPRCTPSKKPIATQTLRPADRSSVAARMTFISEVKWFKWVLTHLARLTGGCGRQFEEGKDAALQLARGKFENVVEGNGLGDIKFAGGDAAQCGEMGAAAQFLA